MGNPRLAEVERENALLQIDLEWEKERPGFLFRGAEPTPLMILTPIVVASIGFLAILTATLFIPAWKITGFLVAILLLIAGAIGTAYHYRKYSKFTQAKDRYSERRADIEQCRSEGKPSDDAGGGRTA